MTWTVTNDTLNYNDTPIISAFSGDKYTLISDGTSSDGVFIKLKLDKPVFRHTLPLGELGEGRFSGLHRYEPFWVKPQIAEKAGDVNPETQFLMMQLPDKRVLFIVPLITHDARFCLQGAGENQLDVMIDTGDPHTHFSEGVALYLVIGAHPQTLAANVAPIVMNHLKTGRLRIEKPLPAFIDTFGWCTWDAFYRDVSHEKVREGLQSFADGGIRPRFLILDDGWQSVEENRLVAFHANDKFPDDIGGTVKMAKSEFGIDTFIVWHALLGYWRGVHPDTMKAYRLALVRDDFHPGILHYIPNMNEWEGGDLYRIEPESIHNFYHDYHRYLRQSGVDGVKVDNQARLEGLSADSGGRVYLMHRYHEALEGSVNVHFKGNLINCMSCSNDMIYGALASNIIRSSIDFWPQRPATHGEHLYTNALFGVWFGQFLHPDWDMFQSGHPVGAFHAAGRAVSGSPIYVSDKPDAHDFNLLRKLVLPDGRVMRPIGIGTPTADCLFRDPTQEAILLKIENQNVVGNVIGVFNAHHEGEPISDTIYPAQWHSNVMVYAHNAGTFTHYHKADEPLEISLPPLGYDILTLIPITDGIAPIGLVEMFNSAGAIILQGIYGDIHRWRVRGQGKFVIYAEHKPKNITYNTRNLDYDYDEATKLVTLNLTGDGVIELTIG